MVGPKKSHIEPQDGTRKNWRLWRLILAWTIAIAIAATLLMVFREPMVSADGGVMTEAKTHSAPLPVEIPGAATCGPSGTARYYGLNMAAATPSGSQQIPEVDSTLSKGCGMIRVWIARLTVGGASDSSVSYLGYAPPLDPNGGALSDTDFSHAGVDYNVDTLFYQDNFGRVKQLVFNAGAPLSDDMVLELGRRQFSVSDSLKLGSNSDIHAWRLSQPLDWTEGQEVRVRLKARR